MQLQQLLLIVVAIVILGLIWRAVRGVIRLVLTVGLLLVIGYILLNALR